MREEVFVAGVVKVRHAAIVELAAGGAQTECSSSYLLYAILVRSMGFMKKQSGSPFVLVAQFDECLSGQLVQRSFINTVKPLYCLFALISLHLDRPGLDDLVLLQQIAQALGCRTVVGHLR